MLRSLTVLLLLLLCSGLSPIFASSSTSNFLHAASIPPPDTTSCPDDFQIDLGEDVRVYLDNFVYLFLQSNRPLDGDEIWLWSDPDNLSCTTCSDPVYSPTESTTLSLSITDGDGCIASTELFIEVLRRDDVYVPNAFSPNYDGKNDVLIIYTGADVRQIERLRIFTRKGDLVFESSNFLGNDLRAGWDGVFNGEPLNAGTYVYLMEVELSDGTILQQTGTINLIR